MPNEPRREKNPNNFNLHSSALPQNITIHQVLKYLKLLSCAQLYKAIYRKTKNIIEIK